MLRREDNSVRHRTPYKNYYRTQIHAVHTHPNNTAGEIPHPLKKLLPYIDTRSTAQPNNTTTCAEVSEQTL